MEHLTMELMSIPGCSKLAAAIPADADRQYLAEQHRRFYGHHDGEKICRAIEYHIRLAACAGDYLSKALGYLEDTLAAGAAAWERPRRKPARPSMPGGAPAWKKTGQLRK